MIWPPFDGPRLKVRRARKHIHDLSDTVAEYGARVKLSAVPFDVQETHISYVIQFSEAPPETVPMIIGDAIHNLRSALDIMICDIARLRNKSSDKLKFPFAADEEKLESYLKKDFPRLGEDVLDAIRALKPYKFGNLALRGLHELDIDDKHEVVLPYYLVASGRFAAPISADMTKMMKDHGLDIANAMAPICEGGIAIMRKGVNPWKYLRPVGTPQPYFPRGLPFGESPVLKVLNDLAEIVEQTVESFAAKFGDGHLVAQGAPLPDNKAVD